MSSFRWAMTLLSMIWLVGCGNPPANPGGGSSVAEVEHDHSHEGAHGGQVIELGTEVYHAELVHDDATHKVGIYLLDEAAKGAAPIDASSVTVNCRIAGEAKQFELAAVPQEGDGEGRSSYFELVSEELVTILDSPDTAARLSLTIEGKPYVGPIETGHAHGHDHDHGHAHEHGDDHGHE
jgi:hypothetical protein